MVKVPDNLYKNIISREIDNFVNKDIELINFSYGIESSIGDTIFRNSLKNISLYLFSQNITDLKEKLKFMNEYKSKIELKINPIYRSNLSKIIILK